MKNSPVMTKERMVILIVGLVALIMAGAYRFYPAIAGLASSGQTLLEKSQRIEKYQSRALMLLELEDRILFLTRSSEKSSFLLFSGTTPDMANVSIQNMLRDMSAGEDISFKSLTVMKPDVKTWHNIIAVPVRVVFSAKIRQVKNFLFRIETAPKIMSVTELTITKPGNKDEEGLNVMMTLQGYMENNPPEEGA